MAIKIINNNKERGDIYEKYISNYLSQENENSINWIWHNIPEEHLINAGIIGDWNQHRINRKLNRINKLPDLGCDILYLGNDGEYKIIQCKFYNSNSIGIDCLAGFNAMMLAYDHLKGIVYHTSQITSNLLSLKQSSRIIYIKKDIENKELYKEVENKEKIQKKKYNKINILNTNKITLKPRDYQLDAYNLLKNKNRTILQLPCGMGKTLISIMLSKDYNKVIVLSNLKAHCEQNKSRFEEQLKNYKTLLVQSDGTRDIEEVKKFINSYKKTCIFSTYKSLDIIMAYFTSLESDSNIFSDFLIIIDEFHNISYGDVYENIESPMYKLLNSKLNIMFMSATPRLFYKSNINDNNKDNEQDNEEDNEQDNEEDNEEDNEQDNEIEDIEIDNKIFGNIDYKYEMSLAIENKYVSDYEIFIPSLVIKVNNNIDKIYDEMTVKQFDKALSLKVRFLLKGCLEKGSKKCIIYNKSHQEANDMKIIINSMAYDYFAIKHTCETILSTDKSNVRNNKLKQFIDTKDLAIICSVDILNECIDIPKCDSIFITYTSHSNIRNIQRLCRANRIDKDNIYKIANIFLWIDNDYCEMGTFIKHIKEFDSKFTVNKIKRLNCTSNNNTIMKNETNETIIKEGIDLNKLIVGFKKIKSWDENLQELKNFININNKLPSLNTNNKNTYNLSRWLTNHKKNYKYKQFIFKNQIYIEKWIHFINSYSNLFLDKTSIDFWIVNYNKVEKYICDNKILPPEKGETSTKTTQYMARWITKQKFKFSQKIDIMENELIYNKWTELRDKYPNIFTTLDEDWDKKFKILEKYVKDNNKLPSKRCSENIINKIHIGKWFHSQKLNYKKKKDMFKKDEYCKKFEKFINQYSKLFATNETKWFEKLNFVNDYIKTHNELSDLSWLKYQLSIAKKRIKIMKNDNVFNAWNKFVFDNKSLFLNDIEIWEKKFNLLLSFIEKEKRLPIKFKDESKFGTLNKWIYDQNRFYICAPENGVMSKEKYKVIWKEFIDKNRNLFVKHKLII